ncbi:MAG: hypothetical protein GY754_26590 [bacterium]|nr:hypothetical protein [bacterium]
MKKNYCINMGMVFLMLSLVFLSGLDINANGKQKKSKLEVQHEQIKADVCVIYQVGSLYKAPQLKGDRRTAEFDYLTDIIWRYKAEDLRNRSFSQWIDKKFNRMEHYTKRNKVKSFTVGATLVIVGVLTEGVGLVVVVPTMLIVKGVKVGWNKKSKDSKVAKAEDEVLEKFSGHHVNPGSIAKAIKKYAEDNQKSYHQALTSFCLAMNINILEEESYITRVASEIDQINKGHFNFLDIAKSMKKTEPAKLTKDTIYKSIKLGAAFEKNLIDFECHLDIMTDIQKGMDELVGIMSYLEGERIAHVKADADKIKKFNKTVKFLKNGLEKVKNFGLMAKLKKAGKNWAAAVALKGIGTYFLSLSVDAVATAQPTSMGLSAAGGLLNMFMVPVEYEWYDHKFKKWESAKSQHKETHDSRTALAKVLKKNIQGCQKLMNSIRDNYTKLGEFVDGKDPMPGNDEKKIDESFKDIYADLYAAIICYRALSKINNDLLEGLKLHAKNERLALEKLTEAAAKSYGAYCELNDIGE